MKCTECTMENIEGALFCEECGAKLEAGAVTPDQFVESGGDPMIVLASAEGSTLSVPAKDEVIIGREDPVSEVFPDVDLTELGGMDKGVSRAHAALRRSGGDFTLEDLGSTNGTYINKKRIAPHLPQPVKPGDELRFGKLSLSVQAA